MLLTDGMRNLLKRAEDVGINFDLVHQFAVAESPVDVGVLRSLFLGTGKDYTGGAVLIEKGNITTLRAALRRKSAVVAGKRFLGSDVWCPETWAMPGKLVSVEQNYGLVAEVPSKRNKPGRQILHLEGSLVVSSPAHDLPVNLTSDTDDPHSSNRNISDGVKYAFSFVEALAGRLDLDCGFLVLTLPASVDLQMRTTAARQVCSIMSSVREILIRREICAYANRFAGWFCWSAEQGLAEFLRAGDGGRLETTVVGDSHGSIMDAEHIVLFREQKSMLRRVAGAVGSALGL